MADIKNRLSIEDVVARYVPLKRAGRSFKALCPFHSEKTPSFVVSPERQLAYCFGCHKGGDHFSFVQEIEHVEFKEALKLLAEQAGLDLSQYSFSAPSAPAVSKDRRDHLYALHEEAKRFFVDQLMSTVPGREALNYLEARGLDAQTLRAFELGFAPDSFETTAEYLYQKGYSKEDLLEVGLVTTRQTDARSVYDRFRGRLMFPIRDVEGRLAGFGGRALKEGDEPKYLNSPESTLYHKGKILYGFYAAKPFIRKEKKAVVVEGYMDVLSSVQAGVAHVVASSGTAFTLDQLKLLARSASEILFAFDTDRAGEEALRRSVELGQTLKVVLKVVRVPESKDPDECIQHHPELWNQALAEAPYYLDYYLRKIQREVDLTTLAGKQAACADFLSLLKRVSPVERDHFIQQLSFVLNVETSLIYEEFQQLKRVRSSPTRRSISSRDIGVDGLEVEVSPAGLSFTQADYFIGLLLRFPDKIDSTLFSLPDDLFDGLLQKIYKSLLDQYNNAASLDVEALFGTSSEEERKQCELRMVLAESRNTDCSDAMVQREMQQVAVGLKHRYRKHRAETLMQAIRAAQGEHDLERERALFQEYSRWV